MVVMPEDRFQSLNELLAEIEAPPPKKFRFGSLVLIGAGLAAAAGAFVIVSNQGRAPTPEAVASAPAAGSAQAAGAAGTDGATPSRATAGRNSSSGCRVAGT